MAAALKLGIKQAAIVAASSNIGTDKNVTGSSAGTPYKKPVSSRVDNNVQQINHLFESVCLNYRLLPSAL
jgi:hypothetical protein